MLNLTALVGKEMSLVDAVITSRLASQASLIPDISSHILAAGGKRLRPKLALTCAKICGYNNGSRHINLAACVELLHTATLLHDDVVDASDKRRGVPTANSIWGNKASVLVGDYLLSQSFNLMVADGSLEVLDILSDAAARIAEGEVLQLAASNDITTSYTTYIDIITAKTARLFASACKIGAVLGANGSVIETALENYGLNLGIAFQLSDDALDYNPSTAFGKNKGNDFFEGKITLPIIIAFAKGDAEEQAFWRTIMTDESLRHESLQRACDILQRYNTLEETIALAESYANKAIAALDVFSESTEKNVLCEIANFCSNRAY